MFGSSHGILHVHEIILMQERGWGPAAIEL